MTLLSRWMPAALAALLLVAGAARAEAPVTPWPQANSDLPADASVRFGTLPNGMRYAIKRNATPTGGVSLRLRIDAGSLMERDDEQGIAHMLEHMAFRGSAHVADGDTVKILQSLGLTFGADTNAFTYPTQTVFSFDMPKNDAASVDTALLLLREIAGELNITQAALDTERNVVLAEAHLRDVPASHVRMSDLAFLYGDRSAAALTPIGLESIIAHATPQLIRNFYEAWYRPERATLMIVGDIDPDALEAKIKASFSNWHAKAPPRPVIPYTAPAQHPDGVRLFTEAGAQPYIVFNWLRPYDGSPDNKANETRDVLRFVALGVLNQRLSMLAHGANPPFIAASASHSHMADVADVTELIVDYRSGQGVDGLKAAERAWRDVLAHGVNQDEVDQVVAQLRTFFQGNAAAADTTPSSQVMNGLLRSADENTVFTAPASDLALYEEVVKGLTAARVSEALQYIFGGTGPLVFVSSASPMPGGAAAVTAALGEADTTPLAVTASVALPPWPYGKFGKPGTVTAKNTVADLGVTFVRFANGVTLTVKPTQLHVGQILMNVRIGAGRSGLPRDRMSSAWALSGAFVQGGLARYSIDDLQKRMANRLWGASLSLGDDEFSLAGQARVEDLDAELQVLAAYVTDPAWQPEALDQTRIAYAGNYAEAETSPSGLLSRELYGLVRGGDPRWRLPTLQEAGGASVDGEKAVLAPALASGPLDVTMVGDVTVDQAIRSVAATFGALPRRPAAGPPVAGDEHFPAAPARPVMLFHTGAANQAVAAIVWPTKGFFSDMRLQRTLRVLSEIFAQRLLDDLRTREGITYTPGAASYASLMTDDYGFLYALAQIPPSSIANFYTEVAAVVADLKKTKVGDAELERARGPRIQDIERQQQTNEYWLSLLGGAQQNPRLLDVIRSTLPDLKSVTAEDVQKAAQDWLRDDKAYRLIVAPQGWTPPPG
ncbi:MAG TPA: insulinase family protein [Rhizomicrobium sp.]|jgi:zinc protease|nr:insulinase family protein [Rhizomicrobium sp.]